MDIFRDSVDHDHNNSMAFEGGNPSIKSINTSDR